MSEKQEVLLTIFLLTYNHESYIRDTFEGILIQKTKYPFVVKILEDCSTDDTLKICQEYVVKYPDIFILINQPTNTKGEHCRWAFENEIQTPYWCCIEGDDYYIDSKFFEKGLNFLEENKEYNMYCGDTIYDRGSQKNSLMQECNTSYDRIGHEISFDNYIYLHSSARMFRNVFDFKFLKSKNYPIGDIYIYMLYLDRGKSYFEHKIVSNYRITGIGVWSKLSQAEQNKAYAQVAFTANSLFKDKYATFFINWLPYELYPHKKFIQKIFGAKIGMKLLRTISSK